MSRFIVIPQKADICLQNGGKLNLRAAVSTESDTGEDVQGELLLAGKWSNLKRVLFPLGYSEKVFFSALCVEVISQDTETDSPDTKNTQGQDWDPFYFSSA